MKPQIVSAQEAVKIIKDSQTLAIGGAGAGHAVPDGLMEALGKRYQESNYPKSLKIIHPCGLGENNQRGLNHLALDGLVETTIGGFWGNAPKMVTLAQQEKIKGYNLPQGVLAHLMRATAGGEPGMISKTGLHSFVDPRLEGGKINKSTTEDVVKVVEVEGEEFLYYKTHPIDVAFIRGTSIDAEGNLTMEEEVGTFSMFSLAQAAKVNGGTVIAQVKKHLVDQHAKPCTVKVPGVLIDYVVIEPHQSMTFITDFEKAMVDRTAPFDQDQLQLEGIKKIIARRAALELKAGNFVNLGYGMPDGVPIVARQSNQLDKITFMIEQGQIDGAITTGLNFGAMYNPTAIVDDGYQFDQFHGGILDICFLGFAQVDQEGNVNSSRFGKFLTGCGGFIDISQNTRKVVFCGAFSAKSEIEISHTGISIIDPGKHKKFLQQVEQVTFSGSYSKRKKQQVLIITERAVFELNEQGLVLKEIAPGVDLEKDVLDMMDFQPLMAKEVKSMPEEIFGEGFQLRL